MPWAELLLVLATLYVAFAWVGYPLAVAALARLSPRPVRPGDVTPSVSVIVTVLDEEATLPGKLENTLELEYPGRWEVIVASDGSTDGTEDVARAFAPRGVRLVALRTRSGKEAAQAAAIRAAGGEILVFTDVAARLEKHALPRLVRPFADARVGAVSSEDAVALEGGEGLYVRYEMAIRRLESRAGGLVGLSGSCFAVRRTLAEPWPTDLASDFRCALECLRRGLRAVSEPTVRVRFGVTRSVGHEWRRKVRTARRGLAVLSAYRDLLHPRHGRAAFFVAGHKLARFTAWIGLVVGLVAAAFAAPHQPLAAAVLGVGLVGSALGLACLAWPVLLRWRAARLALYVLLVHASTAVACLHHLRGGRVVTWEPTRR